MTRAELKRAVRVWLFERERSQDWLAAELGISGSHLSRVLAGYATLTPHVKAGLQRITGIDADATVGATEEVTRHA